MFNQENLPVINIYIAKCSLDFSINGFNVKNNLYRDKTKTLVDELKLENVLNALIINPNQSASRFYNKLYHCSVNHLNYKKNLIMTSYGPLTESGLEYAISDYKKNNRDFSNFAIIHNDVLDSVLKILSKNYIVEYLNKNQNV